MILGITGPARSGKDTVADMIDSFEGVPIQRVQIAGPLKTFCREVFDWSTEHTDGPLKDVPDPRYPRYHKVHVWQQHHNEVRCASCGIVTALPEGSGQDRAMHLAPCTTYLTPREAMQRLGDDWSTPLYEPIWAIKAARTAKALSQSINTNPVVVVTDCRFTRDIRALKDVGGIIVQIHRGHAGITGAAAQHRGEVERHSAEFQTLVDHHIHNEGTLDDLRNRVGELMAKGWMIP